MANSFFNASGVPGQGAAGVSAVIRAEIAAIAAGFDKLPSLGGNANQVLTINSGATGLAASSLMTLSGALATIAGNLTVTGNTVLGDAAADALTVASNAVTWSGNPTHSGNHAFSGTMTVSGAAAFNGGATLGDASGDALTINSAAVSVPNGLNFDSNTLVIDATNNRVGIGIASPTQALDVVGAGRFTGQVSTTLSGTGFSQSSANSGGFNVIESRNTSNTANSNTTLAAYVAGASAGDPVSYYEVIGSQGWSVGIDNSDADAFVIAASGALGTNNTIRFSTSGAVTIPGTLGVTGAITASGGLVGALTGNASTATALQTARTINGVSFDGSANITVAAAAGTLTGATLAAGVTSSSLTSVGTLGSLGVSGAITANSITVSSTGNGVTHTSSNPGGFNVIQSINTSNTANSSTTLAAYVAGSAAGDPATYYEVTGSTGWSVGIDNSDSDAFVIAASGALGTNNALRISTTGAVTIPGTLGVTGAITGALTGNASTATTLQTARNINGVSFNGSSDITVTAAAGTLTGATLAAGVTASSLTSVGTLGSLTVSGAAAFNGTVALGDATADTITINGTTAGRGAAVTYTPTYTSVLNCLSTPTNVQAWYTRHNDIVEAHIRCSVSITSSNAATSFRVSLPVSSTLGAASNLIGVALRVGGALIFGKITGSTGANEALIEFTCDVDSTTYNWNLMFSYLVL